MCIVKKRFFRIEQLKMGQSSKNLLFFPSDCYENNNYSILCKSTVMYGENESIVLIHYLDLTKAM